MAIIDINDTYEKVTTIIAHKLEIDKQTVTPSSTLADLGADSLDMAEIIIKLEEQLNIEVDDERAEQLQTVQEVVDYVHALRTR